MSYMKNNLFKLNMVAAVLLVALASCNKSLNLVPTNDITEQQVYSTPQGYTEAIAKVYLAMGMPGNVGTTGSGGWGGQPDIPSQILSDEGNSDFLRGFWYLQELSTDEAGWTYHGNTDPLGIHQFAWSSINQTVAGAYFRSYFQITLCNEFIRQSADASLTAKGFSTATIDTIHHYRAEARFLRAFQYWILMDLFGNVPFATDSNAIGSYIPKQIHRADLFKYVESELKAIDGQLATPHNNQYGRVDQAAEWALLARMYLNAQVYTGTPRFTDAITYANKVIGANYTLHGNYKELMLADNNLNTDEFIFTIPYDGKHTQNYGGTTTLVHGPAGVPGTISGCSGTWGCIRVTQQFVDLFDATDVRGQFYTSGQNKDMTQLLDVTTDGYSSTKFRNVTRSGGRAPDADSTNTFSDVDFPLFRLGEIYLIYAESVVRGGTGGDMNTALGYVNQLRTRAYGGASGNLTSTADLTLDFLLQERGRELFWECFRRTDLIRFGKFTTNGYIWAWKGGVASGTAVPDKYNIFPIPSTDLSSNPNLIQNNGY
jgi:hypothetical protein